MSTGAPLSLPGFDPPIGDQCPDGETPSIAGYDIASGALSWLTCLANGSGGHGVMGVDGEMVLAVELIVDRTVPAGGVARYVGIDARDGTKRWELDSPAEFGPNGVRWTRDLQQMEVGGPWTASENVLFTIRRSNLTALSTTDGSTLWWTNYPFNDPVQMTSAAAGATTVIVSFSSQPLRD